jgi:lysophospholipase L1-like esterase
MMRLRPNDDDDQTRIDVVADDALLLPTNRNARSGAGAVEIELAALPTSSTPASPQAEEGTADVAGDDTKGLLAGDNRRAKRHDDDDNDDDTRDDDADNADNDDAAGTASNKKQRCCRCCHPKAWGWRKRALAAFVSLLIFTGLFALFLIACGCLIPTIEYFKPENAHRARAKAEVPVSVNLMHLALAHVGSRDDSVVAPVAAPAGATELPAAAAAAPAFALSDTFVALGDSITEFAGYVRNTEVALLRLFPDTRWPGIINAGVAGDTSGQMLDRFTDDVVDRHRCVLWEESDRKSMQKTTLLTINAGVNDMWKNDFTEPHSAAVLSAYTRNVETMVDRALDGGMRVLLLTPTIVQESTESVGTKRLAAYAQAMRGVAAARPDVGLVDLHAMFVNVLRAKNATTTSSNDSFLSLPLTMDGVHMVAAGNAIMAVGLLRGLGVSDDAIARLRYDD